MSTVIIGFADPHFSDRRPRSQKDGFQETQRKKLSNIILLSNKLSWEGQEKKAAAILIAGDTFHQPKGKLISRQLDHALMQIFRQAPCPILAIAGNHDMLGDRLDSLNDHPLGTLVAAGLVHLVHWPDYVVVGEDPPVIVTGREYKSEGPGPWLDYLAESKRLLEIKEKVSNEYGKKAQVYVMTHNFWGPNDGNVFGDPVVGHGRVKDTGIDTLLYGHPHSDDGCTEVIDTDGRKVSILGPGALLRNTIAEHDVGRKPSIAVTGHNSDGTHKVVMPVIPHDPPELVFDMEKHERVRKEKAASEHFIQELANLQVNTKSPEQILEQAEQKFSNKVVSLAKQFLLAAEAEV